MSLNDNPLKPVRHVWMAAALGLMASCSIEANQNQVSPPDRSMGNVGAIEQADLAVRSKSLIQVDGLEFRDLNADGELAPYEDWRLSADQRARDLLKRMTLAEKAGTMFHSTLPGLGGQVGVSSTGYDFEALEGQLLEKYITSYITRLSLPPQQMAKQSNLVQEMAEGGRLGIPVTISTDPRNHFQYVVGASGNGAGFSQWPEALGLAALGDTGTTRQFADIARQEYRAVGIHEALSPQLDLVTEPRWSRATGTFGSSDELSYALGHAYVAGFQGGDEGLQSHGVLTVAKHWVGYGAEIDGFDAHNYYGRYAQLTEAELERHIHAFEGALDARTGGIMPAYTILKDLTVNGKPVEQTGAGYSSVLLQDILRNRFGYEGIILSDWGITRDCNDRCRAPTKDRPQRPQDIATGWGVQDLEPAERYVLGIRAGLDQFGGVDEVEFVIEAVESGELTEERIDESVLRILMPKFRMGLFENPYVDETRAAEIVGNPSFLRAAADAQRRSQVLLQNASDLLPVAGARTVYLYGVSSSAAEAAGLEVVDEPADADFALIRAEAPSETLHPYHFFGSRQKEGRLDFRERDAAYDALIEASGHTKTVFAVFLDRPAILSGVADKADAILANFGASDAAILDVVLGKATPEGRLPFELPSSMAAVEAQRPGAPDDSIDPLFSFGFGLGYSPSGPAHE